MKFRHAATLAVAGWYLMLPPLTGPDAVRLFDVDAPIGKWEQAGAYDSAESCKASQSESIALIEKGGLERSSFLARFKSARCIASDDPRLKQ